MLTLILFKVICAKYIRIGWFTNYWCHYMDFIIINLTVLHFSAKPTTYKIEKSLEGGFIFNAESTKFQTIEQLILNLRSSNGSVQIVECLPPSEYGKCKL